MLMALPWMKFKPVDWRADPRLRMCSLAARGLWIDLLTYMHEGVPYGHLTIDGVPPPTSGIDSLVGRPLNEVVKALAELEMHGVFARAENGAIVSRRMVRDKAKADRDRENGKHGGNPNLLFEDKGGVNPPHNPPDKAKKLEARIETPENEIARAGARYSAEFEEKFWQPYPRTPTMSKLEAWKAWQKSLDDHAAIIAAVPRYAAWLRSKPDHPAVHACRFITQRRFDGFGEPEPTAELPAGSFYAKAESAQLAAWDAHIVATRGRGLPRDRNGGWRVEIEWPPGHPKQQNGGEDAVCTQTPRAPADA